MYMSLFKYDRFFKIVSHEVCSDFSFIYTYMLIVQDVKKTKKKAVKKDADNSKKEKFPGLCIPDNQQRAMTLLTKCEVYNPS